MRIWPLVLAAILGVALLAACGGGEDEETEEEGAATSTAAAPAAGDVSATGTPRVEATAPRGRRHRHPARGIALCQPQRRRQRPGGGLRVPFGHRELPLHHDHESQPAVDA